MSIKLNSSGGGSVTLQEPVTASNFTLTLPAATGNVLTDGSTITVAQGGTGLTSPGTNGNVLTSNGSAWTSSAAPAPADGSITPAKLSTGGPSWTSGGVFSFNSGYGSVATAYGCRAWVNFNGSTATIRASGNVSSVTRNGTGDYTLNFTSAFPDTNYSMAGWARNAGQGFYVVTSSSNYSISTSAVRIQTAFSTTSGDCDTVMCNVFR